MQPRRALTAAKERLAQARDDERAERLIEVAEATPLFRYRQREVRPLLEEAGRRLTGAGRPDLEARCLYRLAHVELDEKPSVAREIATELGRRAAARRDAALDAQALALESRAARRQEEPAVADELLRRAALVDAGNAPRLAQLHTYVGLTLATADKLTAELSAEAVPLLRHLLNTLDDARVEEPDARFQASLQLGLGLRWEGRTEPQLRHLRALVTLVKAYDDGLDLLEVRLTLGTALAAAGEHDEARRVLQHVIDQARDLDEEKIRILGLVGLSAAMSGAGAVQGAVARAVESASASARLGDVFGYVRGATLAAQVLLKHRRDVQAVELLMYTNAALRQTAGEEAAALIQAQLDALREEWGEARFEEVCRQFLELRAARARAAGTSP